jgi:hypothetical protein
MMYTPHTVDASPEALKKNWPSSDVTIMQSAETKHSY